MDLSALDHDFNNTWGSVLSVTELQQRPIASLAMKQYWEDPVTSRRNYGKIVSQYTSMFESFFQGIFPISYHGHVTDALCPVTVMGMLMRLAVFSVCDKPESIHAPSALSRAELASLLGFGQLHLQRPKWAVVEGCYAAGFGSIANLSAHPPFRDHATGDAGIEITITGQSQTSLSPLLNEAKQQGCIGVIVEIVNNQSDGRVTTPDDLRNLSEVCRENSLLLAVDETMTALRCGAPFAYQRSEYEGIQPDLVFFGKALNVNGIGINFDGPCINRLSIDTYERRMQAVYDWQAVVTRALPLPVLIDAIGVLEMAVVGDWVGRSRIIGCHLRRIALERARSIRKIFDDDESKSDIELLGGLDSFIFVHKKVSATFRVMGASSAGSRAGWVRWLPRLDQHLLDLSTVENIMLNNSRSGRGAISKHLEQGALRPQWCFHCGGWARETVHPWCKICYIDTCDAEECLQQMLTHKCPD